MNTKYIYKSSLLAFVFLLFSPNWILAQTDSATFKLDNFYGYKNNDYIYGPIQLTINKHILNSQDTLPQKFPLHSNMDTCFFQITTIPKSGDTIFHNFHFLSKFKKGNTYKFVPGCCCASFSLHPVGQKALGSITYHNLENRELILFVGDTEFDTISIQKSKIVHAQESPMCMFKPIQIRICEIDLIEAHYATEKYKNSILAEKYFLFLHGENIEVFYDSVSKSIDFKYIGSNIKKE